MWGRLVALCWRWWQDVQMKYPAGSWKYDPGAQGREIDLGIVCIGVII